MTWHYFIIVTFLRYQYMLSQIQSTKCSTTKAESFRKLLVKQGYDIFMEE